MVYTVCLRWTSFKQDISNIDAMLGNQPATYAILRHAHDIPDAIYRRAMNLLLPSMEQITNKKLTKLLKSYAGVTKVGMVMDEEFIESLEIPVGHGFTAADRQSGYTLMIEEVDED